MGLLENPAIYDAIQKAAGLRIVESHMRQAMAGRVTDNARILDMGGGTGLARHLFPARAQYTCIDNDEVKLQSCARSYPDATTILGDCTASPIAESSQDVVLCKFIAHHLDDFGFARLLLESRRVLMPDGIMVLVDPLWLPRRLPGRMLWSIDRGSHPRTAQYLRSAVDESFESLVDETFAVWHGYLILVAQPRRP